MKALVVILILYSAFVTHLLYQREENFTILSLEEFVRNNGSKYSQWAFGNDWNNVPVYATVKMWNLYHPESPIGEDCCLKDFIKKVGTDALMEKK